MILRFAHSSVRFAGQAFARDFVIQAKSFDVLVDTRGYVSAVSALSPQVLYSHDRSGKSRLVNCYCWQQLGQFRGMRHHDRDFLDALRIPSVRSKYAFCSSS